MRLFPTPALRNTLALLLLILISTAALRAQNSEDDRRNAESFIDSMAHTVYNLAWPTAKYRSVSLDSFEPAEGGFDVIVKLSGLSAFDDSDLWVKLAFMFRNGKFYDISVKEHNAFLVPPFVTTKTLASVAVSLAKEYDEQQKAQAARDAANAPPPYTPPAQPSYSAPPADTSTPPPTAAADDPNAPAVEGVCLHNPTNYVVNYQYRWGNGEWKQDSLKPNMEMGLFWKFSIGGRPSPQLVVRYEDDSVSPGVERVYNLDRTPSTADPACETLTNYHFGGDGTQLVVYTGAQ